MKNLFFILFVAISCDTENTLRTLHEENEQIETLETETDFSSIIDTQSAEDSEVIDVNVPDIEIEHIALGPLDVKQTCQSTGEFSIRNIGTADLVVSEIDAYATVPADVRVTTPMPGAPFTLHPLEQKMIDFEINQSDDIDDSIMLVAKSNDPDEPIASKDANYTSLLGMRNYENFTITEGKEADILIIVDNSCSMNEEQIALGSNSELFINTLDSTGVDYRIAVITTDSPMFVGPIIVPTSPDPALELSNQVNVGTAGSPYEMGLLMASKAMSLTGMAAPGGSFLRRDARLSLIWISDEDDFSGGLAGDWARDFWSKKASPGDVSVWGIIGDPTYGCFTAAPGDRYYELLATMGGSWTSICSTDWGAPLSGVAGRIGVDSTLELVGVPIPSTIRVFVGPVRSYDWVYVVSSNAVSFNPGHAPAVGSIVTVDYAKVGDCD